MRYGIALVGAAVALLAGCGSSSDNAGPPPPGDDPASLSPPSGAASSPSTSSPPEQPVGAPLPEDCAGVATSRQINVAIDQELGGETSFIVREAEPDIGRTGRVTCEFGVPADDAEAGGPIEVSVSAYVDEQTALDRVALTVTSSRDQGAEVRSLPVGDITGTMLRDDVESTLVYASGTRTVAITISAELVDGGPVEHALSALGADVAAHLGALDGPTGSSTS